MLRFLDGILGLQDEVDAVHRCQSHGNLVGSLRQVLQRIDDAVEDDHEEDEGRCVDEVRLIENQETAKPQYDDDDNGAQELRHGMSGILAQRHGTGVLTELVIDIDEALQHLLLGNESLDDAQSAQRLIELCQHTAPHALNNGRLALQFTAYRTHNPSGKGCHDDDEDCQLPTYPQHGGETYDDGDGLSDEHVDTAGNTALHGTDVTRHTGNDITLSLLAEEAQRQLQHLLIHLDTDISYQACLQRYHDGRRGKVTEGLQTGHDNQCCTHVHQRHERAVVGNEFLHPGIAVVEDEVFVQRAPRPFLVFIDCCVNLEQDIQDGDEHDEREHIHPLCHEVEHYRPCQVFAIWPQVTGHDR